MNESGTDGTDRVDVADGAMPRWVWAFVIAGIVLAVLVVALLVLGDGNHGPSRHTPGTGSAVVDPPAGHTLPSGGAHG